MSATAYVDPESDESSFDDEDDAPALNDVKSLRQGIIKTTKHDAQAPYSILLVGETGTGKSTFLEFLDNVLTGKGFKRYEAQILDQKNEEGGSGSQSQTNSARIYELSSNNGISVRILDTPGLADTRGLNQDALHKKNITTEIEKNLGYVNAVLILANGSIPRITASMDYALTTLSALFPKSLANNIAFLLSSVPTPASLNFPDDVILKDLKDAPKFLIDNPIALQKNYLKQKGHLDKKTLKRMKDSKQKAEEGALEMLVELFDWLDDLEPQPTNEIITLYEKSQDIESKVTDTLAQMDQAATKMAEIEKLKEDLGNGIANMNAVSSFETIINSPVWKKESAPTFNYLCGEPKCHSTCREGDVFYFAIAFLFQPRPCVTCQHSNRSHFHALSKWVEKQESQVTVDEEMKTKYDAAKDKKEKIEVLAAASKRTLDDLRSYIKAGMDALAGLQEEYAGLSLSGCFSGSLEKAIRLLELHYESMEQKGVSRAELNTMRTGLKKMKRRLDVLNGQGMEALGAM